MNENSSAAQFILAWWRKKYAYDCMFWRQLLVKKSTNDTNTSSKNIVPSVRRQKLKKARESKSCVDVNHMKRAHIQKFSICTQIRGMDYNPLFHPLNKIL